jgi:methylphosphotriester-DNA--protein-cysteine methyltransferase
LLKTRSVADTADELSITTRQLQRSVLAEVGLAPKSFQRVARFQRFLRSAERGVALGRAAVEAGYADQAHLTREVRRLSGLTPSRLIAERRGRPSGDVATVAR